VTNGQSIVGLYPLTESRNERRFAAWRAEKKR
jgi:hypothetical protein